MTDAETAFATATRMIEEARETGTELLDLNTPETDALDRLPAGIGGLSKLKVLNLNNTQITDLSPLTALTSLSQLFLDNTPVTDLSPLTALTGLFTLSFDNTQVTDLLPLTALTGLSGLSLDNTPVTSLSALTALTGLSTLSFDNTQVTDLLPLSAQTGLSTLSLDNTQVTDLSPLTALTGLSWLSLDNTQVTDLSPLTALKGLTVLSFDDTQVTDLSPISALTRLSRLYLNNTQVPDLSPLTALTRLSMLYLAGTQVTDLRPLRSLTWLAKAPQLSGLTFTNTPATRIDPRIAEIAEINDDATRARELFAYLEDWVPPVLLPYESEELVSPSLPESMPAPVAAIVSDDRIKLAKGPSDLDALNATMRAEIGWQALQEFRESFGSSFHVANYAPLPAILKCFDSALGKDFASCRPIAVGMHGQRIISLSQNQAFLDTLPNGAEPELKALAAAISVFVERFPEWREYIADASPTVLMTEKDRAAFVSLDQVVEHTPQADQEFKDEFHAMVVIGTAPDATEEDRKGLTSSARELIRDVAEQALKEAKQGNLAKRETEEMARIGATEFAKIKWYAGGFTLDILHRASPSLRQLALRNPKSLGWLTTVLDYFGTP